MSRNESRSVMPSALLAIAFGLACLAIGWIVTDFRMADQRKRIYEKLDLSFYTDSSGDFPWYSSWLHRLRRDEQSYDLEMLVFNNFCEIDDGTLADIAQFTNLHQLWLNGQITVTDAGLDALKSLRQLEDLSLADANVSPLAVKRLREALPRCKITWDPPELPVESSDGLLDRSKH
jgi:hypothetical protein